MHKKSLLKLYLRQAGSGRRRRYTVCCWGKRGGDNLIKRNLKFEEKNWLTEIYFREMFWKLPDIGKDPTKKFQSMVFDHRGQGKLNQNQIFKMSKTK